MKNVRTNAKWFVKVGQTADIQGVPPTLSGVQTGIWPLKRGRFWNPKTVSENSDQEKNFYAGPKPCFFSKSFLNFDFKKCGQNKKKWTLTYLVSECPFFLPTLSGVQTGIWPLKRGQFWNPKTVSENSDQEKNFYAGPKPCFSSKSFLNFDFKKCGQNKKK